MSNIVIKATDISKQYRLGLVGSGTLKDDVARFWAQLRGKEDPTLLVGQVNDRTQKADSDYVWALKDINFEVKQGEILGIIGKNGAGKSTLLKILSKITAPTTGSIKVKGRIASLLEVGTGFHGELTGRENIYLNGAILGMSRSEITKKIDEIIDFAGVDKYIDTPVKRYSSGMTVRLGFAVAAHLEPEILVVDEVLAVGDAEFQKKAIGKMKDVSRDGGRTVLFVSHNMASVQNLCTRGILLKNGLVLKEGKINSIISEYLNTEVVNTDQDLSKITDRIGNGNLKIQSIELLDNNNRKVFYFQTGKDFIISVKVKNIANIEIKSLQMAIGIDDKMGSRITVLDTDFFNLPTEYFNQSLDNTINIFINNLSLASGQYNLTFFLRVNGEIADWFKNGYTLEVETGDFFKTGKVIPSKQELFYINHNFEICSKNGQSKEL